MLAVQLLLLCRSTTDRDESDPECYPLAFYPREVVVTHQDVTVCIDWANRASECNSCLTGLHHLLWPAYIYYTTVGSYNARRAKDPRGGASTAQRSAVADPSRAVLQCGTGNSMYGSERFKVAPERWKGNIMGLGKFLTLFTMITPE